MMLEPPLSIKSQLLYFLAKKEKTTKEIRINFGNGGNIWTILNQLESDKIIERPRRGVWRLR